MLVIRPKNFHMSGKCFTAELYPNFYNILYYIRYVHTHFIFTSERSIKCILQIMKLELREVQWDRNRLLQIVTFSSQRPLW